MIILEAFAAVSQLGIRNKIFRPYPEIAFLRNHFIGLKVWRLKLLVKMSSYLGLLRGWRASLSRRYLT